MFAAEVESSWNRASPVFIELTVSGRRGNRITGRSPDDHESEMHRMPANLHFMNNTGNRSTLFSSAKYPTKPHQLIRYC